MADQRRAGIIQVQVDGEVMDAKGAFSYNLGAPKRDAIVGQDRIHGYKEFPQQAFIEGSITDRGSLDLKALVTGKNQTITIQLANGKMVVLRDGWFAGEGTGATDEGEIAVRWEGNEAEEIS